MKAKYIAGLAWLALGLAGVARAAGPEVLALGFDKLASFEFVAPEDQSKAAAANRQIPEKIREFDAKKVAVTGFMLPVKMDGGLVTEFLLMKDQAGCCYGAMPKITEWILVRTAGKGVAPMMDVPITFEGTLRVGLIYDGGYPTGLYLLNEPRRVESKG